MSNWTIEDQRAAIVAVMEKANVDAAFNVRALADPAAAVKEVTGKDLPAGYTLRFVPNNGADLTLVLPDLQRESEELSDAQLEQVAGGRCSGSCAASCAATSTVGLGLPGVGGVACV